ncbi:MAG TPA: serine/threonine-protein kinase [Kofleriaceae bacterium]
MAAVESDPLIDTVIEGRYRVIRKIAEGGMSAIYEVQHTKLMRQFALKYLLPELTHIDEAVQRFQREAELLASLRHINVVEISDWVTMPDAAPGMILEFLHGNSLQVRLLRGAMQWDAIARIGDQTMSALQLAHRNGITHRDLKPENIFISIDDSGDERVKLLDFGVSKLRGVERLSGVYRMLGTPSYMSPEQASAEPVGPSTDVWAMGAILYEMATQQVAYKAPDVELTLEIIREGKPPGLTQYRKDAPPTFVKLVEGAISRDPTKRIQTIDELRAGLREALEPKNTYRLNTPIAGVPVTIVPPPIPSKEPDGAAPLVSLEPEPEKKPSKSGMGEPLRKPSKSSMGPPISAPVVVVAPSKSKTWLLVVILVALATAANVAFRFFV